MNADLCIMGTWCYTELHGESNEGACLAKVEDRALYFRL